jgi:hypothetical protein
VQPECAAPFTLREILDLSYANLTGGSFMCGEPGGDDPLSSFTLCEGLPPYNNLHWANYQCPDATECSYEGAPYQSEVGGTVNGPVCSQTCRPGTTICYSLGDGVVNLPSDDFQATGEGTISCNDEGEWDFSTFETCAETLETELGREQWCGPNLQGTANSFNIGTCMEPACAYWFSAYHTFALPDGVGACGTNGNFYQCLPDGSFARARSCTACMLATQAPGSGFPDTFAGYDPGSCINCVEGEQACVVPISTSGGSPYYRQCEDDGSFSTRTCSGGELCRDYVDLDARSSLFGLGRIQCGGECSPHHTQCGGEAGKQIRTCSRDGSWSDFENCDEGACHADDLAGSGRANCEAECIPGTFTCPEFRGTQAVECTDAGRYDDSSPIDCDTSAGETCIEDIGCQECEDGGVSGRPETRCNPDDATQIQVCIDDEWADAVDCPGSPGACVVYGTAAYCLPQGSGTGGQAGSSGAGGAGTAGVSGDAGQGGLGGMGGVAGDGAGGMSGLGGVSGDGGVSGTTGVAGSGLG